MTSQIEKCAHPACSCPASSGKYCSNKCESMGKTPEIACGCDHTDCEGNPH